MDDVVRLLTTVKGGGATEKPIDDVEVVILVVDAVTPGGRRVWNCGDNVGKWKEEAGGWGVVVVVVEGGAGGGDVEEY